jgi:hypothetical protein
MQGGREDTGGSASCPMDGRNRAREGSMSMVASMECEGRVWVTDTDAGATTMPLLPREPILGLLAPVWKPYRWNRFEGDWR